MIEDWEGLLAKVAPHGNHHILDEMAEGMPLVCEQIQLNTPKRVAHALAQWFVESAGYTRLEEDLRYRADRLLKVFPRYFHSLAEAQRYVGHPEAIANHVYGGRKDLGNTEEGDGYRYRGGGITQTTGRFNYRKAGYEDDPDALRSMPGALLAAAAFWDHNHCNAAADRDSVLAVTKIINGGTNGLAERQAAYKRIRPLVDRFWNAGGDAVAEADVDLPEGVPTTYAALQAPEPTPAQLTKSEVTGLQQRLVEFGYREVGKIDGLWGGRTAGALAAYQTDRDLPVTGKLDAATKAALALPFKRPVSEERANATVTTLAAQGSVIAKQSLKQKAMAWLTGAGTAVYGAVSGLSDYWSDAQGYIGQAKGILTSVPDWVWILAAGGIAYTLWSNADKIGKARVEDERSGKTA